MSRRGLRPSEFKQLQELGYSRKDAEVYAMSGFKNVTDWIEANKVNASKEEYEQFKKTDFDNFQNFKKAFNMGFESREEFEEAQGGNFPNRATWLLAKEHGIWTHKKYLDFLAEQKALNNLSPGKDVSIEESQQTKPVEKVSAKIRKETNHLQRMEPRSNFDSIQKKDKEPQDIITPLLESESEKSEKQTVSINKEKIIVEAHKGSTITELLEKYPLPSILAPEFIDNPVLERIYRLGEVLEQTIVANLEDLTNALAFMDMTETEEYLNEEFADFTDLFEINLEENYIKFQPEIYAIILAKIKKLRN